jgi:hypothetical protein
MRLTLATLAVATVATAIIAEILVGSIEVFAEELHLSDFFVAAVIVAIIGNAAEHGGPGHARRGRQAGNRDRRLIQRPGRCLPDPAVAVPRGRSALVAGGPPGRDRRWEARRSWRPDALPGRSAAGVAGAAAGYTVAAAVFYKAGGR